MCSIGLNSSDAAELPKYFYILSELNFIYNLYYTACFYATLPTGIVIKLV